MHIILEVNPHLKKIRLPNPNFIRRHYGSPLVFIPHTPLGWSYKGYCHSDFVEFFNAIPDEDKEDLASVVSTRELDSRGGIVLPKAIERSTAVIYHVGDGYIGLRGVN